MLDYRSITTPFTGYFGNEERGLERGVGGCKKNYECRGEQSEKKGGAREGLGEVYFPQTIIFME